MGQTAMSRSANMMEALWHPSIEELADSTELWACHDGDRFGFVAVKILPRERNGCVWLTPASALRFSWRIARTAIAAWLGFRSR